MTGDPRSARCVAVGVAVLQGAGEATRVLLLRRARGVFAGTSGLVTGRIEAGETAWQAALREVREETGLDVEVLYTADLCDLFYNPVEDRMEMLPLFVARVADGGTVVLDDAQAGFRWATLAEAEDEVPFVGHRMALREIRRDFVAREPASWRRIYPRATS